MTAFFTVTAILAIGFVIGVAILEHLT